MALELVLQLVQVLLSVLVLELGFVCNKRIIVGSNGSEKEKQNKKRKHE
jgi:hypothetical protein